MNLYIVQRSIMSKKGKQVLWFTILCARLVFIFMDAVSFSKNENVDNQQTTVISNTHNAASSVEIKNTSEWQFNPSILEQKEIPPLIEENVVVETGVIEMDNEGKDIQSPQYSELESVNVDRISLDDLSSKVANRIEILRSLYKKTNDEKVLKVLVDELLSNYQFDEVRNYMSDIDIFSSSVIDKQSYIYTYVNTLAITDPNSMKNFINFIEQMKTKSLISSDDYLFYKWLQKVWEWKYDVALETMKQIRKSVRINN